MYVCMCVFVLACMHACIYVCAYICMHACMHARKHACRACMCLNVSAVTIYVMFTNIIVVTRWRTVGL